MKKVTAFVGTYSNKHTLAAVELFLKDLTPWGEVETEVVRLGDHRLETCRGCKTCFARGEEHCPYHTDDRDLLLGKIMASDGVVFATPVYSFQVSGLLKTFLDRMGFLFHRPRFFGKAFTPIVVQGFYGAGKVEKYLEFVGNGLGFNVVKGSRITALDPMVGTERQKMEKAVADQARRFYQRMLAPAYPVPSLLGAVLFRMGRANVKVGLTDRDRDYTYYRDHGWFDSDYFYPTRLGPFKRAVSALAERLAARAARRRQAQAAAG